MTEKLQYDENSIVSLDWREGIRQNSSMYIGNTDAQFDMNNSKLDDWEKDGNFTVKTFPIENVEQVLIDSIPDNPINKVIVEEMLDIFKEYNKIINMDKD